MIGFLDGSAVNLNGEKRAMACYKFNCVAGQKPSIFMVASTMMANEQIGRQVFFQEIIYNIMYCVRMPYVLIHIDLSISNYRVDKTGTETWIHRSTARKKKNRPIQFSVTVWHWAWSMGRC